MNNSISNYIKAAHKDDWSCLIVSVPEAAALSELPEDLAEIIHEVFQMTECIIPNTQSVDGKRLFASIVCRSPAFVARQEVVFQQLGWTIEALQSKDAKEDILNDVGEIIGHKPTVHTSLSSGCLKYFYDTDEDGNSVAATAFPLIELVGGAEPIETTQ